ALAMTRRHLPQGLSVNQFDHDGVVTEALLVLWRASPSIQANPRAWYRGVIRNLVRQEIRAQWLLLTAAPLPEDFESDAVVARPALAVEAPCADDGRDEEVAARLRAKIEKLPGALRLTAELSLIQRCPRPEVRQLLGISAPVLRKRLQRIRE